MGAIMDRNNDDQNHISEDVAKGLANILKVSDDSKITLVDKIRSIAVKKTSNGKFDQGIEVRNEGWKIDEKKADEVRQLIENLQAKSNTKGSIGIYIKKKRALIRSGRQQHTCLVIRPKMVSHL